MRIPRDLQPKKEADQNAPRSTGWSTGVTPTSRIEAFGEPGWTPADLAASLETFLPIFDRRPIKDNQGGMPSVGLFNVWFLLRKINPGFVIESGVWKGQSTWLIENTAPSADILDVDINLPLRQYISPRAEYTSTDFLAQDLRSKNLAGRNALAFFDDHQDVIPRLRKCRELGIKHIILDDNYPEFLGNRHISAAACLNDRDASGREKYPEEKRYLLDNLEVYQVLPPVFDHAGPLTMEKSFITLPSLLGAYDPARHARLEVDSQDMPQYRWTTYLKFL